jgi:hypothetical protein
MMKNNDKRKGNTAKKLLPAAGMLALSASMLATSTYAWFTMNKEVEVTGLKMQATASAGLEISLGALGDQNASSHTISVNAPGVNDISWKRLIDVSEYYKTVGKLLPASSDDALDIFKVPSEKVYAGGHAVEDAAAITAAQLKDSADLTLQTYSSGGSYAPLQTISEDEIKEGSTHYTATEVQTAAGNYIDIPMWIRSSNSTATNIFATVTVTDPNTANGSDLIKAVRVAIIPIAEANADATACSVSYASSTYASDGTNQATVTPLSGKTASIFGLKANGSSTAMDTNTAIDWPTYHDGKVINTTGAYASTGSSSTLGTSTLLVPARGLGEGTVDPTNVFTIPAATADNYARVGFIARVWLEGESIYCEDATANQDWNIQFNFSTDNTAMAAYTGSSSATPVTTTGNRATLAAVSIPAGATNIKVDNVDVADATEAATAIEAISDELTNHTLTYTPAS